MKMNGVRSKKSGRKFGFALSYEETPSFVHSLNGVTKLVFFVLWIVLGSPSVAMP